MYRVGDGADQRLQELRRSLHVGGRVQLGKGELRHSIDRHEQIELALSGTDLGDVDVAIG